MKLTPNIGTTWRAAYILLGVGLIAGPFIAGVEGPLRFVLPVFGAMAAITGATGW